MPNLDSNGSTFASFSLYRLLSLCLLEKLTCVLPELDTGVKQGMPRFNLLLPTFDFIRESGSASVRYKDGRPVLGTLYQFYMHEQRFDARFLGQQS